MHKFVLRAADSRITASLHDISWIQTVYNCSCAYELDELARPYYTARAIRTLDVIHPSFSVVSSMIAFPCSVTSLPSRGFFLPKNRWIAQSLMDAEGLLSIKIGLGLSPRPLRIKLVCELSPVTVAEDRDNFA